MANQHLYGFRHIVLTERATIIKTSTQRTVKVMEMIKQKMDSSTGTHQKCHAKIALCVKTLHCRLEQIGHKRGLLGCRFLLLGQMLGKGVFHCL